MLPLAIGASLAGGVMGMLSGNADRDAAKEAQQQALAQYLGLDSQMPDLDKAIQYQLYSQGGQLTPAMEQQLNEEMKSAVQVNEDPAMRDKQLQTMAALQELSNTGFGLQDQAAMNKAMNQVSSANQAKQAQILQDAQARGQAGGGASLAAQLSASQGATQQASQNAIDIAGKAAEARQNAIASLASQAGNVRNADMNRDQYNASNQQQWQNFIAQNASARQARNVGSTNTARQFNTQRQQQVGDQNTNTFNNEQIRQRNAAQQEYQNKLNLAQAKAGAYSGQAANSQNAAQNTAQNWQGIGSGVGSVLANWNKNKTDEQ